MCTCACVTFVAYSYHMTQAAKLISVYSIEGSMDMHNDLADFLITVLLVKN